MIKWRGSGNSALDGKVVEIVLWGSILGSIAIGFDSWDLLLPAVQYMLRFSPASYHQSIRT